MQEFFLAPNFLLRICTVFLIIINFVISQVPLGAKTFVHDNNSSWVSPSGDFSFGFFNHSDQSNQFGVGIRFSSKSISIGKQTLVWVAGGDISVSDKSYFHLSDDGELVLVDPLKGIIAWTTNTSQLGVVAAFLRNDGNLVLLNAMNDVVWQSFDHPTDTLLPGQRLFAHKMLRAASKSSISSYYTLIMNASGELQLRFETTVLYWTSGNPSTSNISAILTSGGILQLVDLNFNPIWSVFGADHNDSIDFRFLRLDVDGNLRIYSWVKDAQLWTSVWQAVENQCKVFAFCGHHGICTFNSSGFPQCECPLKSTADPSSKCFPQDCMSSFSMVTYEHTSLYGIYPPNDLINRTSLYQCRSLCLKDEACKAATYTNDGTAQCRIKTTPYYSGYSDSSLSSISFIKACSDPFAVDPSLARSLPTKSPVKRSNMLCIPCLIGAALCTLFVFMIFQLIFGFFIYRRWKYGQKQTALTYFSSNTKDLIIFSFEEIKGMTKNFKYEIGPKMYRGKLSDHQLAMVTNIETTIREKKFRAYVSKIGSIHHKNLLKLHGYCCELGHRFLVYEYAGNGSLEKYIQEDELGNRLTWTRRVNICLSVARALCYLHTRCRELMSHGNLKCENIVLDKNFEAKVSEFWLVGLQGEGSLGGQKDVEDFGKILLMLVTGSQDLEDVCRWAYEKWNEGHPDMVVDKRIEDEVNLDELERVLRIAFWCLQIDEHARPLMGEVVQVLEGTLTVDLPPPPFDCKGGFLQRVS
ncbi:hypothetical protein K2173_028044 [Erythroxylum novogranatense]|uniref:Receptor-like serine/threonine-protein kinase n=1 Tax=Erythroxylum novogranatense TaxID=1862640 RepID=A0AAV8U0N3_9ROSI|nr:hypothetical protein K2173_028044 [Erythroxylum novogranatense]